MERKKYTFVTDENQLYYLIENNNTDNRSYIKKDIGQEQKYQFWQEYLFPIAIPGQSWESRQEPARSISRLEARNEKRGYVELPEQWRLS